MTMHVQIGHTPDRGFDDPLGLMSDCHRRIESFLAALQRVAETPDGRLDDERRRALSAALAYFRDAAPKHTADEEESLIPRLRALGDERVRPLLAAAEHLERDHALAEALHARVERIGEVWLRKGSLPEEALVAVRRDLAALHGLYTAHIALEDDRLFPGARAALSEADLAAIGREMAQRRGIDAQGGSV
ncbi:MAG: hemerythrin domain-containing protein [Phycisphaerales bacterium]|nr:MAG: hemerythrin domain-containing protein [Phycisphaerales bacterium]